MLTYTTDAAKACNVSLNTIRNWCRDYGAFLSPSASAVGESRAFTGRDMEVLKYISLLRSEGMQRGAIMQRLGETSFSEIAPADTIEPAADSQDTAIAPTTTQDSLQQAPAFVVALEAMQRQIDAIQQARQEDKRPRYDTITVLGVGICIGLLFCTILIGLAWLYGGG